MCVCVCLRFVCCDLCGGARATGGAASLVARLDSGWQLAASPVCSPVGGGPSPAHVALGRAGGGALWGETRAAHWLRASRRPAPVVVVVVVVAIAVVVVVVVVVAVVIMVVVWLWKWFWLWLVVTAMMMVVAVVMVGGEWGSDSSGSVGAGRPGTVVR